MKNIILYLLLFVVSASVSAQERIVLDLSKEVARVENLGYTIQGVIDARKDSYCIGMMRSGAKHIPKPVFTQSSLKTDVTDILVRSKVYAKNEKGYILRINYIMYYNSATFQFTELNVSFLREEEGQWFVDCTTGTAKGSTYSHFTDALAYCLNVFAVKLLKNEMRSMPILGSLVNQSINPDSLFINKDASLQKGIYYSFEDFLENRPKSIPFELKLWNRKTEEYVLTGINKQNAIWGVSDGKNIFLKVNKNFFRLRKKESSYYFNSRVTLGSTNQLTPAGGWGVGILTGVVLGVVVYEKKGPNGKPKAKGRIGQIKQYQLDMNTGSFYRPEFIKYRAYKSHILFIGSSLSKDSFEICINDKEKFILSPKEYTLIEYPTTQFYQDIKVTINGEVLQNPIETPIFQTQVLLLRSKKHKPKVDLLKNETRKKWLKKIDEKSWTEVSVQ